VFTVVDTNWSRKTGIGVYGFNSNLAYMFIGSNSYNGNNLRIASDYVSFGDNDIIHTGNYTTTTDRRYLQLSGGTISYSGNWGLKLSTASGADNYIWLEGIVNGSTNLLGGYGVNGYNNPVYVSPTGYTYPIYHTGNFNPANYLPLSGGTISTASVTAITIDTTHLNANYITFKQQGEDKAYAGWNTNLGAFLQNADGSFLCVANNIIKLNNTYTLIHSGNIGSYNAGSATKLQDNTAFTAWGAIYFNNGKPQNVDNSLYIGTNYGLFLNKDLEGIYLVGTGVNWHNASNTWTKSIMRFNSSGNVTIGASDLATTAVKLYVDGDISSSNLWPIITISKSLTITSDWSDTGITFSAVNFPHGNGSYMVQIDHGNCYFYTGVISVVINDGAVTANDVDEIILHGGGFDSAVQYYLRTKQDASSKTTKIQIATSGTTHTKTINFKFKRII
jgi:hypothetical protein